MKNEHPFKTETAKRTYLELNAEIAQTWPTPSEARIVSTSYGETFVRINGPKDAAPMILLSGALCCSLQWLPNISALSKKFRTYAIDSLINTGSVGLSHYSKTIENVNEAVNWLDELFDKLNINEMIYLVGMSYGGFLACQYAMSYGKRVKKLMLVAPAIMPIGLGFVAHAIPIMKNPSYGAVKKFLDWHMNVHSSNAVEILERFIHLLTVSKLSFVDEKYPMFYALKQQELEKIQVPTYLIVGDVDRSYAVKRGLRQIRKGAPHWKMDVIQGAGHGLTITHAGLVNDKILNW